MKSVPREYYGSYYGACPECCKSLSLGELVAQFKGKPGCEAITTQDVNAALKILQNCSVYFAQGQLTNECTCNRTNVDRFSEGSKFCPTGIKKP